MRWIDDMHLDHIFMGARMLRRQLRQEGVKVERLHIRRRWVQQSGASQSAPGQKIYSYLLRNIAVVRSNQIWELDTTYITMARGIF